MAKPRASAKRLAALTTRVDTPQATPPPPRAATLVSFKTKDGRVITFKKGQKPRKGNA